ncbi:DUF58 domain-containing protein [Caldichromatium japonicum]|uniref:DUF58 domain-containing protein n=1 Tax=Caldichromatium japonicum TaxID=2699430 RepID=A0A6G7VDN8_9GAMM|nr:DUF58 domain-containing protein [Caldichromatium japonicum]QIK38084.1 DUF58 domain-containing protein [Caldichromatium japonicum]
MSRPDPLSVGSVSPELSWLIGLRAEARRLELFSRGRVIATRSGAHRSPFRGRGMDYRESRVYSPGDEPRHMDWRLTARRAAPHVKVFAEERERPLWLAVDQGPSMRFGTRRAFKSFAAAEVAALLGWVAVEAGDRVGGLVFDEHRLVERRPAAQGRGLLPLLARLSNPLAPGEGGRSPFLQALRRLAEAVHHGSLIVLISDFMALLELPGHPGEGLPPPLVRLSRGNELLLVLIHDPIESEPPPPGRYPVFWEGQTRVLDLGTRKVREGLKAGFAQRQALLESWARRYGAHWLMLGTDEFVGRALRSLCRDGP